MKHIIMQLITALTGSLGFAVLFHVRLHLILPAAFGGFFSWGIYLLGTSFTDEIFLPTLLSAAFCALYAETLARVFKAPATIFFIIALIPLIPGSTLYYAMSFVVQKDWRAAGEYGFLTAQYALGIAGGASLIWAIADIVKSVIERVKDKKQHFKI